MVGLEEVNESSPLLAAGNLSFIDENSCFYATLTCKEKEKLVSHSNNVYIICTLFFLLSQHSVVRF